MFHITFEFVVPDNPIIKPQEVVNCVKIQTMVQLNSNRQNAKVVVTCGLIIKIIQTLWKLS